MKGDERHNNRMQLTAPPVGQEPDETHGRTEGFAGYSGVRRGWDDIQPRLKGVKMVSPKRPMPKWTKAPDALVAAFAGWVETLPAVETRKMFGYPAVFVQGQMFSGLFQSSMILRLDEDGRSQLAREHGATPFEPMPGRPMREYMVVPEKLLKSGTALALWLKRARDYAASLPPKEKAKRKAPRGRSRRPSSRDR